MVPRDIRVPAPSLRLLSLEPLRALLEFTSLQFMSKAGLPRGDGHPVVVFPGLATDAHLTAPLRRFCEELGYAVHDWGLGINRGPFGDVQCWLDDLTAHTAGLIEGQDRATLVGWSLGGIYAREVAKRIPGRVRRVISIGSPFAGDADQTNVSTLYRLLNGGSPRVGPHLRRQFRQAPPVPTTCIYSRSDGVVAWQACVQPRPEPHVENIEVEGSHCGMGWNPEVLEVVAGRLAGNATCCQWGRRRAAPRRLLLSGDRRRQAA